MAEVLPGRADDTDTVTHVAGEVRRDPAKPPIAAVHEKMAGSAWRLGVPT